MNRVRFQCSRPFGFCVRAGSVAALAHAAILALSVPTWASPSGFYAPGAFAPAFYFDDRRIELAPVAVEVERQGANPPSCEAVLERLRRQAIHLRIASDALQKLASRRTLTDSDYAELRSVIDRVEARIAARTSPDVTVSVTWKLPDDSEALAGELSREWTRLPVYYNGPLITWDDPNGFLPPFAVVQWDASARTIHLRNPMSASQYCTLYAGAELAFSTRESGTLLLRAEGGPGLQARGASSAYGRGPGPVR